MPELQDTQVYCSDGELIQLPKLTVGLVFPELDSCQQFNFFPQNSIILPDYSSSDVRNIFFELLLRDNYAEEPVELIHNVTQGLPGDIQQEEDEEGETVDRFYDELLSEQLPDLLLKETKSEIDTVSERCKKKSYKGEIFPGDYPYKCSFCDKRFKQVGHVNHHERKHTGNKKHECELCKKRFNQKCHLVDHMRLHTGERPFKCDECGKSFTFSSGLRSHVRIHSGERLFACSFCEKTFNQRTNLKTHERLHTGDRKFMCSCCGKCFNTKSNLTRHPCKPLKDGGDCIESGDGSATQMVIARDSPTNYVAMWQPELIISKLCEDSSASSPLIH